MFVEPLGGWRDVSVTKRKTAVDWAYQMRDLLNQPRYISAERVTLVCDNLNTHDLGLLYEAFAPEQAKRLADKLEIVLKRLYPQIKTRRNTSIVDDASLCVLQNQSTLYSHIRGANYEH